MKNINPLLPIIILILTLTSCSNKWHIVKNGNKMNNLKNWKQDRIEKQEAKKVEKLKYNAIKINYKKVN